MQYDQSLWKNESAPRYTSYPTAPHFHDGVDAQVVASWLDAIGDGDDISLYLHVPFCDRLCWFCACHTKHTLKYAPVKKFLASLHEEIRIVSGLLAGRAQVRSLHLGGGSPTMLKPQDLLELGQALRSQIPFAAGAAISAEIDPNDMDDAKLDAFEDFGLTRASIGVQDFDIKVQRAIGRDQSFALTEAVVDGLRERGIASINLDLLYGLPHQTSARIANTLSAALSLKPQRIALFGYAHVPWFKKHQQLIDESALPGFEERLEQSRTAADIIRNAGYMAIGLDHFARPEDSLAIAARSGGLRRNFQGYTDDACENLIGLGPSSISRFRPGYAQNIIATSAYEAAIGAGKLAVARGIAFTADDHMRAWVIERLMCEFGFSTMALLARFGEQAQAILQAASLLAQSAPRPLLLLRGERYVVPPESRPFVRSIAAKFDRYLDVGKARHSLAV